MAGLLAFGAADGAAAAAAIAPLRDRLARIGGSHAQRDVVEQTLLAAAARGGDRVGGTGAARRARPRQAGDAARRMVGAGVALRSPPASEGISARIAR